MCTVSEGMVMNSADETNAEKQRISRNRRARAYALVKAMAQQAGYMKHQRDGAGLDRFLDDYQPDGKIIYVAVTGTGSAAKTDGR